MSARERVEDHGLLRFLTCGSVDDGKSTLIGRLLFDTKTILVDTLHAIARTSEKRGLGTVDLSLLTDGLQAEREQGITIDVGIPHLVVAINKMDLVGHSQATYEQIRADYLEFAAKVGIQDVRFLPISALNGDMIVDRGDALD